ncbi:MAG: citrate/2-methylcitrate synthase [Treponema sp.]|nr:citrate/2-methylcitrate synthase [Treponema sp.]MCL2272820.1 citrate/2-methylcitrate synthase [Treponema sp.]
MENIKEQLKEITDDNYIKSELYEKFNVKRGLRNSDGTGVLVGLTRVGEVHGYIVDEGEKVAVPGKLYYRGVDVEDITSAAAKDGRFCFEETIYLLLFGRLPNRKQLLDFTELLGSNRALPKNFAEDVIMRAPSKDIMNKLGSSIFALYPFDEAPEDQSPENVLRQCINLIARFPTIVAYAYMSKKHYFDNESLVIHPSDPTFSTAETLLSLIRPDQKYTEYEAQLLDLALVLHAEHGGGNNSTFAVHVVSSADTDTYSTIASGIGSLKGFKHGGANAKVISMMDNIMKNVKNWESEEEVSAYLEKILKGEAYDGTRLIYGQGHAVYTITDPRAILLRDKAEALAEEKGLMKEFNLHRLIERLVPVVFKRVKGSDKEICTNVDFYSGFVYKMLGIPAELNTPIFAISRIAGWCAHRLEEIITGGRIIRPAYKCVQQRNEYIEIEKRKDGLLLWLKKILHI